MLRAHKTGGSSSTASSSATTTAQTPSLQLSEEQSIIPPRVFRRKTGIYQKIRPRNDDTLYYALFNARSTYEIQVCHVQCTVSNYLTMQSALAILGHRYRARERRFEQPEQRTAHKIGSVGLGRFGLSALRSAWWGQSRATGGVCSENCLSCATRFPSKLQQE